MDLVTFQEYLLNGIPENATDLELTSLNLNKTINNFTVKTTLTFSKKAVPNAYTYSEYNIYCNTNNTDYNKKVGELYTIISNSNKPSFAYEYEISGGNPENYEVLKSFIDQEVDEKIIVNGQEFPVNNGIATVHESDFIVQTPEDPNNPVSEDLEYIITCKKRITEYIYTKSFSNCEFSFKDIYGNDKTNNVNYNEYSEIFNTLFNNNLEAGVNTKVNNLYPYTYSEIGFQFTNYAKIHESYVKIFNEPLSFGSGIDSAYDLSRFNLKKTDLPDNFFIKIIGGRAPIIVDYSKISIRNRQKDRIKVSYVLASTKLLSLITEDTKVPSQDYMNFLEERIKGLENEIAESKVNHIIPTARPANPVNGSIWIS